MRIRRVSGGRLRLLGIALAVVVAGFGVAVPMMTPAANADSTATLPTCPFWTNVVPPVRGVTPWVPPLQTANPVNFTSRLPTPAGITGTLSGGQVTITLNRVPGAQAYRVWRNGQSVAWISDFGQPTLTAVDTQPCQNAFYSVVAMSDQSGSDASMGQLSSPYQLAANGTVVPWQIPVGSTIPMLVTSYNDGGQTASAYNAQLGVCAVDPRVVPWGTYFTVPGYGTCYAGDIGTWIQNDTVDLWLPGTQANNWGVQDRTITIIANPFTNGGSNPPSPTTTTQPRTTTNPPPTTTTNPTPPPPTALTNGGFESGAVTPWTCDAGTAAVVASPAHTGTHALGITPTSSDDAQCTQTVTVQPNHTYTLTDWVRGNFAYLGVTVPGGTGASTFTQAATGYTQLTTSFTTTATTTSVTVFVHGWYSQGAVDVDDVALS
jgi:3D (Asp-Asp-Asp) domain-containing protein